MATKHFKSVSAAVRHLETVCAVAWQGDINELRAAVGRGDKVVMTPGTRIRVECVEPHQVAEVSALLRSLRSTGVAGR